MPAVAEVAAAEVSQPVKVPSEDAAVHTVHHCQLLHPFVIALGIRLQRLLPGDSLDIACREAAQQRVDDQHHEKENDHRQQQALDDVFAHRQNLRSHGKKKNSFPDDIHTAASPGTSKNGVYSPDLRRSRLPCAFSGAGTCNHSVFGGCVHNQFRTVFSISFIQP